MNQDTEIKRIYPHDNKKRGKGSFDLKINSPRGLLFNSYNFTSENLGFNNTIPSLILLCFLLAFSGENELTLLLIVNYSYSERYLLGHFKLVRIERLISGK